MDSESSEEKNNDEIDSTVESARNYILSQQQSNVKCRGPYLAEMELQCRLVARRDEKAKDSAYQNSIKCFTI